MSCELMTSDSGRLVTNSPKERESPLTEVVIKGKGNNMTQKIRHARKNRL